MNQSQNPPLNFVDIFSGAGGLSCGLELSGMRCLLGVDHDKHAIKTFAHNHPHAAVFCGPVQELDQTRLLQLTGGKKIHAVVGGPPCQGFSTVGRGDPEDLRNQLFRQFCRVVKVLQPDFVVMENVTGLLAKKNQATLKGIIDIFSRLGLHLEVKVLEAEKFGVAEKRRRTIFIGSRWHKKILFPETTTPTPRTVGEVFKNLVLDANLPSSNVATDLDLKRLALIPEGKGVRYQEDEERYWPVALRLGVNWKKIPEGRLRQAKYQRLHRQLPAPTIMTSRYSYYHPTENRHINLREAAAIQSFPNNFIFFGGISAMWRQVGNAVPPLLGKAIGEALQKMHATITSSSNKKNTVNKKKKIIQDIERIRGEAFLY